MNYQPIFIIGAARSGTNMLRDIITQLPQFATWDCDEINPIWRHGNLSHPNDVFTAEMATPNVKAFIRKEFTKIAKRYDAKYIVEKSCANSLRVPFLNAIFPQAKYIFIYRDGRDTVVSAAKRWKADFDLNYTLKKLRYVPLSDFLYYAGKFGKNRVKQIFSQKKQLSFWGLHLENMEALLDEHTLYEICALQWKAAVEMSDQAFSTMSDEVTLRIRYEDFVISPKKEFKRLLSFVDFKLIDPEVEKMLVHVSAKSIGNYKKELSKDELTSINQLLKPTLERFGYA